MKNKFAGVALFIFFLISINTHLIEPITGLLEEIDLDSELKQVKQSRERKLSDGHGHGHGHDDHADDHDHHEDEHDSHDDHAEDSHKSEENPSVHFDDNSELEHMRNFQAISGNLKAYEDEYMECLREIEDPDFSEDQVDGCIGRNFIKVIIDIKYVTMKTMSQADSKIRSLFIKDCYNNAFENEEFLVGCDVMERDVLNMMWTGLSFVEILHVNEEKYLYEYGKIPVNVWEDLNHKLEVFSHEFFELIDEIDSHKEVTILRLKNYIDDRIKLIAEAYSEHMDDHHETKEVHHSIDIVESHDAHDNSHHRMLPQQQIGSTFGHDNSQNRYINNGHFNSEIKNQHEAVSNSDTIPLLSRFNEQRNNRDRFLKQNPSKVPLSERLSFQNLERKHFKAMK